MKRIFITGASSGIGEGLARHYGKPGAVLGLVARRADVLAKLADELRASGATVHVYPADVADTSAMKKVAEHFVEAAGGVDLVIANAGVGIKSALRDGGSEDIARLLQVNVIGVTNTIVPFVPAMVAAGSGILCTVSSMAGHRALPGRVAYSASKKAVTTFMDGARMELAGSGVHAMTVCPGFVNTPMTQGMKNLPFAVECDDAVAAIVRAIEGKKATVTFPWQMNVLKEVLTRAPEWLVRRTAPKPRNRSTL
jgi:short-subunit dehydrogenase